MPRQKIKEIFSGTEEMIKTALDLEVDFDVETGRLVQTASKEYWFSVKLRLLKCQKQKIKYKCGHESDGTLILDSSPVSISAYLRWSESVGVFGDKSKCWECWCEDGR